jgi:hypothetical protein
MTINDPETRLKLHALKARMAAIGITRQEICRRTGLSSAVVHNTCGGYGDEAGPISKRLIEVCVGMPVWSTPEEFHALTQQVRCDSQRFSQNHQQPNPRK